MKKSMLVMLCLLFLTSFVIAVPIEYVKTPNPESQQDPLPNWTHELGIGFPADELIEASCETTNEIACQLQYGGGQNYLVTMTNLSGRYWYDVTYVADPETTITNDDLEFVNGQQAFLIDYVGSNQPLIYESKNADAVFEPNETWTFIVQEYVNTNQLMPSALSSWDSNANLGQVGSQSGGDTVSSGSIIVIPEPATILLLVLGAGLLRRNKN